MQMPSIAALERATLTTLPAPRAAYDGTFVMRAFHGGTGRGNSASSLDPPGLEALLRAGGYVGDDEAISEDIGVEADREDEA